jgi:riboflavin kinase/FMN adenylyltransferase
MNATVATSGLQFRGLATVRLPERPLHLAVGIFDGVHLGHQSVIEAAVHSARRSGGLAGVLTFDPHPSRLFNPQDPVRLIMPVEVKTRFILERLRADFVIVEPFGPGLAAVPAEGFVEWLRARLPRLAALFVGENWRFGQGRRGDVALLIQLARASGIAVFSAQRLNLNGEPISSTRIRSLLEAGEIETANALLGYSYFATGVVEPGRRLGRTLGFPTHNLPWSPDCRPAFGVYVARVHAAAAPGGLPAIANYGVRPTVDGQSGPLLEAHVLGPSSLGPGDAIEVEWLSFLRPERRFADLEALRAQIGRDRAAAVEWWAQRGEAIAKSAPFSA